MPPRISGSGSIPGPSASRPMPCGPSSPLCPGMATMSAFSTSSRTSSMPAVCAASTSRGMPFSLQTAPRRCMGCTTPVTLLAWLMTASAVRGPMAA